METKTNKDKQNSIIEEIIKERKKQDEQWGGQEHDDKHVPADWLVYIMKFMGRMGQATQHPFEKKVYRDCMIKTAALALAAIESIDRQK